jgi:hypothetical protein
MSFRIVAILLSAMIFGDALSAAGIDEWFLRDSGTTNELFGIAFASNTFVAVGSAGYVARSSDAISWINAPTDVGNILYSVTHGSGLYVAVGQGMVLTSSNAADWNLFPQSNLVLRGISYGTGRFVAVGYMLTSSNTVATALTSTNGTNWELHEMGVLNEVTGITFGNGFFVAVSGFNRDVLVSTDGVEWMRTETPCYNPRYAVAFGNDRFVAVGAEPYCPSFSISSSVDGVHWVDRQSGTDGLFFGVGFGSGTFVAVGGLYDAVTPDSRITTSRDGFTWTPQDSPASRDLQAVAFGNETFVAVGKRGTVVQSGNVGDVSLSIARIPAGVAITITGQPNWTYRLQASSNLLGDWQNVAVVTNSQNGFALTNAFDSPTGQRYYRVIAP